MVNTDKSNKMFQSFVILTFFGRIEQNNDEAHLQVMVNACMKYQINPTTGLRDMVWTRLCDRRTDGQTDRQTDGQTDKLITISRRFTGDN